MRLNVFNFRSESKGTFEEITTAHVNEQNDGFVIMENYNYTGQ